MLSRKFTGFLLCSALVATGTVSAQEQLRSSESGLSAGSIKELLRADTPEVSAPTVLRDGSTLYVESFTPDSLSHLHLEVSTRRGQVVYSERVEAIATTLSLDGMGLPDGAYRYKVTAFYLPDSRAGLPLGLNQVSKRSAGAFTIRQGLLTPKRERIQKQGLSREGAAITPRPSLPVRMAGWLLDLVVAEASAATFEVVEIESSLPYIYLDSITDGPGDTDGEPWEFEIGWDAGNPGVEGEGFGTFLITEWFNSVQGAHNVFTVDYDEATTADALGESIHIYDDGDIWMANGNFQFGRDGGLITEGTGIFHGMDTDSWVALDAEDTSDANPDVTTVLHSSYVAPDAGFGVNFNFTGTTPFFVGYPAPTDSLRINKSGTVSLAAGGSLHVGSSADPVGQFTITSADQPRFEMNDTSLNKRWRFSVAGGKFAINQLDFAGTEFQVFDNGNVTILGALTENSDVNAKQDIVRVDPNAVLARIVKLPISEWSYIDAPNQRHIGPMAQDFHASFGLGGSEKQIATLDTSGVALAGIKALKAENDRITAENQALRSELNEQKIRLAALEESQVEIMATLSTLSAGDKKPLFVVASTDD
jgi:hypothetical protein